MARLLAACLGGTELQGLGHSPVYVGAAGVAAPNDTSELAPPAQAWMPPLYYRPEWVQHHGYAHFHPIEMRSSSGASLGWMNVHLAKSRLLPGHRIARLPRFGDGMSPEMLDSAATALATYAQSDARLLRLVVNVFARQGRDRITETLMRRGFRLSAEPLTYRHTRLCNLEGDETEFMNRLDARARRDLRDAERAKVQLRVLTTEEFAEPLATLERLAMSRSGGSFRIQEWPSLLGFSAQYPNLSRVVGLFLPGSLPVPENLVAFAWGCMHGSHGEYRSAGTARLTNNRIALSAPLLWDLMLWSKRQGATFFDLGGVSVSTASDDPLQGISNFKRRFGPELAEVGEDLVLEAHPMRAGLASGLGEAARLLAEAGRFVLRGERER